MGGQARRDLRVLISHPGSGSSGSHQHSPQPPTPAALMPELDTLGAWQGEDELVAAERFCAFQWVGRLEGSCAFRPRAGACEGLGKLAAGALGWERHPKRIRCRAREPTVRSRERTASSGATAAPTESRGGPGVSESLRSFPLSLNRGIKSNQEKKKIPTTSFSNENKNLSGTSPLPSASQVHSLAPSVLAPQRGSE